MDAVVREVNAMVQGRGVDCGVIRKRGKWLESESAVAVDDTVLIGNSRENLQQLLNEFHNVCKRIKLMINVGKSKVIV